jgi:hypothetical protein
MLLLSVVEVVGIMATLLVVLAALVGVLVFRATLVLAVLA